MEILCKNCGARLTVPDNKIPIEGSVQVGCPRCKARLSIGGRPQKEADLPEEIFYEEGLKLALILDDDETASAHEKGAAERLGFKAISASDSKAALARLGSHDIELVIMAENFDGRPLTQSPIMEYLNRIPMVVRRRMLLVIVGDGFRSGDAMEAFSLSADAVASRRDLARMGDILRHAAAEKERLYRPFNEILAQSGRY